MTGSSTATAAFIAAFFPSLWLSTVAHRSHLVAGVWRGCTQIPSPGWCSRVWQSPSALGAVGRGRCCSLAVAIWGCQVSLWELVAKASPSCHLPVPRSCAELMWHKGPGVTGSSWEQQRVPTVIFVLYNKQIHTTLLLAIPVWGWLPSARITWIYCVILEWCLSLAGFFKPSFLEGWALREGHRNPLW